MKANVSHLPCLQYSTLTYHGYNMQYLNTPFPITAPPQNVELRPLNATALAVSGRPPPHNTTTGIVLAYTLRITELESGETKEVERESNQRELVLTSLHADYHYNVSISSNTSAGEGPFSPPVGARLPQDGQ